MSAPSGGAAWSAAARRGMAMLTVATPGPNRWTVDGREFVNMCSSAYLGLNSDPRVLQGAIDALRHAGVTGLTVSTTRMRHHLQSDLEDRLDDLPSPRGDRPPADAPSCRWVHCTWRWQNLPGSRGFAQGGGCGGRGRALAVG